MSKQLLFGGTTHIPMIYQTEAAECGLACLAMVACAHGYETDLNNLRGKLSLSLKGMNLAQLMDAAAVIDMAGRPLKLELQELKDLQLPCILHWNLNHFVVLKEVAKRSIVIYDPATGIRKVDMVVVSQHFTGVALELFPTQDFKQQENTQRVRLSDMLGRLVGVKRQLIQIFIISLGLQLCALLSPLYIQWIVDHALMSGDKDFITLLSAGFLMLVFVQVAIGALRGWVVLKLSTQIGTQWSVNVFSHMLKLPQSFYEKRHLGDIISRFNSIASIQKTLTTSFIEGVIDSILAILTLIMMWIYSTQLTWIVLASVVLYGMLRVSAYAPFRQASEEGIVLGAKQETSFLESIRGIQAIKLFAREVQRQTRWHNHLIDTTNRHIKTERLRIGYGLANGVLAGVANVTVIWLGAQLILGNAFSIGMLFAFVAYKSVFTDRMMGLIDKAVELKMLSLHTERLADIVLTERENDGNKIPRQNTSQSLPAGDLSLQSISFRYSDLDPLVLKNVALIIPEGKSVAIVGPSGCGKTTLAKIILGLLVPTDGVLLKGGVNRQKIGISVWRSQVNAVMQDDQLFAGSILDNICFFEEQVDKVKVEEVSRQACIHTDIEKMNMGYNTLIGDMGTALSGGQKQRLLLARALYRNPQILVLDEATSHLDIELERAINHAIQNFSMTRIVIAHRPETIASCDVVIRLPDLNAA
jgi:ATP-binding cassette, subfamily B, bacterial CvaB/MchF/RaxB